MANGFKIEISRFFQGLAPLAHTESLTELGNKGHASSMTNCDVVGETVTQGPALADLTNGTQAGVVDELISHILDTAVANDTAYGIGATKLFEISSTTVASGGTPSWPVTITNAVAGKSVAYLKGKLFYFFNRAADAAIGTYDLSTTFNHTWQTGLNKSDLIPSATKEDILIFGHGKNVGVYFDSTATMTLDQLDFGDNHEVADIAFHGNQWIIAVNSGTTGTNRTSSQIYTYEAGATTSVLSDETAVGLQRIGFVFPFNGIVYVAYQDLSFTGGYKIGYISGRRIETLAHFTGTLPDHRQKTLYKNMILFAAGGKLYTAGSIIPELPFAISQHAPGGHSTVGAVAAPFGEPMVASTVSTNYRLAKFSGYSTNTAWRSIIIPVSQQRSLGYVSYIEVFTRELGSGASCDLKLEINQAQSSTSAYTITTGNRRHILNVNKKDVEDLRVFLDWSNGSATNPCPIRKINIYGNYAER